MRKLILILVFIIGPLSQSLDSLKKTILFEIIILIFLALKSIRGNSCYRLKPTFFSFALYFIWSLFILIYFGLNYDGIIRLFQFVGCSSSFYLAATYNWRRNDMIFLYKATAYLMVFIFLYWLVAYHKIGDFRFIYNNPNTLASFLLVWLLYLYIFASYKNVFVLICIALLFLTDSRTSFCIAFLLYICLIFKNKLNFIQNHSKSTFFAILAILLIFVFIYPTLMMYTLGTQMDSMSQEYFGKGIQTGRHYIWLYVFDEIKTSPLIGHGLSATPILFGESRSCHNLFLQTALQSGFIGMILLIGIIYSIYSLNDSLNCNFAKNHVIVCVFSIMAHECFEVTLTQNYLSIGIIMWFLMGLPLNERFDYLSNKV